ncbi:hypothetical protein GHT09_003190 [Marmota monax]|uniref:Uncharacterized protein n=1 Tax=Marmota monax TaxID=9995 RepID=A0A834QTC1_MARMO|nr:hypothetical protein GHT09_003190 [Marmota monax]
MAVAMVAVDVAMVAVDVAMVAMVAMVVMAMDAAAHSATEDAGPMDSTEEFL